MGGANQDREKLTGRLAPTSWQPQRKGRVRTRKESDRAKDAHSLETIDGIEGGTTQETETERQCERHSLPGDHRGQACQQTEGTPLIEGHSRSEHRREKDKSVHGKECPSDGHSLSGDCRGGDILGHGNKTNKMSVLTFWRRSRGRKVRT